MKKSHFFTRLILLMNTYRVGIYFLCGLILLVSLLQAIFGYYPFNISEALILGHQLSGGLMSNAVAAAFFLLISLTPVIILAIILAHLERRQHEITLKCQSVGVCVFLATLLTLCFLIHLVPTFFCNNPMCDYLPVVASFPGLPLGITLAKATDALAQSWGGIWATFDYRFLALLPNAVLLWLLAFYFWLPKEKIVPWLRARFLVCALLSMIIAALLAFYLYRFSQIVFTLSDGELADLLNQYAPAQVDEHFHFQIGDVLIHRPKEIGQDLVTKLTGANLSHTDTYCGEKQIINGNGDNYFETGGINIDELIWQQRYISGSLPATVVLRHRDPEVGERLCANLRQAVADPHITFGVDMLGKRQTFNCSNMVYYYLYPQAPNFNLVTPDLLFVTMLQHDWQLVNWTN